ncbi:MAG: hypothetical protein ACI4EF_06750 [Coprococcus sp.]
MKIGYLLLVAIMVVFILASVAEVIYLAIYKRYISKRIANGISSQAERKSMITPFLFFGMAVGVLSIVMLLFLIFGTFELRPQKDEKMVYASLESCRSDGIISNFSAEDEIAGYTRQEIQSGACRFVYYLQTEETADAFPTALLYVEYDDAIEYEYQYQLEDDAGFCNASDEKIKDHNGWYAVITDNFYGTLIFTCTDGGENCSIAINFAQ